MSTPARTGFRMPAEWYPHERCWMAWPCRRELWGSGLVEARQAYGAVARAIAAFEPVTMVTPPGLVEEAKAICGTAIGILPVPLDDSWIRDTGPTFVIDGRGGIAGCAWRFNAWGGKYADYAEDALLAGRLLAHLGLPRFDAPLVLEGGAIHSDGEGTLLTTESVLLNPNRTRKTDRAAVEGLLMEWTGARKVIWLPEGLVEDETDGHVDNVACFAAPGRVLFFACSDSADPNYRSAQRIREALAAATDAAGRRLDLLPVEHVTLRGEDGRPSAASYINFYVANEGIVMPKFSSPLDEPARRAIAAAFPGRAVTQVDARAIVRGGGGIHCITQQQPRR